MSPCADAAGDLYERYSAQLYGYCLHQLGSREEAEDAVQTTFMNAFRGLQRGIVPELESAWLFKIAHNVCLSRRRSSWRRGKVESPNNFEVLQEVVPGREHVGDELIRLQDVLEEMPENQRRAILLREWQGLTYREVADELGVSQAAVETLIFRARRALAAGLEQDADTWKKRLRRGADAGSAIACIKALLSGGGAATVKVAATALAVATVGAAAITAPATKHSHSHRAPAARTAPKAHAVSHQTSRPALSSAAKAPVAARKKPTATAAPARHPSRPVALPASKPEETTSAPSASMPPAAEAAPTAPTHPVAASEPAPAPPPARPVQSAGPNAQAPVDHGRLENEKNDNSDRRPQSTLAPPAETNAPSPADPQPAAEPPTPQLDQDKSDRQGKQDKSGNGNRPGKSNK